MTTRVITGDFRRTYRPQRPRGVSVEDWGIRAKPIDPIRLKEAQVKAADRAKWAAWVEARYCGAVLREIRARRGIGRPRP